MLAWIGNAFLVAGLLGVSNRRVRPGFALQFIGNALWLVASIRSGNTALGFLCAVFLVITGYGFWNWRKS